MLLEHSAYTLFALLILGIVEASDPATPLPSSGLMQEVDHVFLPPYEAVGIRGRLSSMTEGGTAMSGRILVTSLTMFETEGLSTLVRVRRLLMLLILTDCCSIR